MIKSTARHLQNSEHNYFEKIKVSVLTMIQPNIWIMQAQTLTDMLAVEGEKPTCIYERLLKVNDEKYCGCKY
jgi:hypothetical protein